MDTRTTGSDSHNLDAVGGPRQVVERPAQEEAQHLFELAQRDTEVDRNALYGAVADLFERREEELLDGERALMLDILHRLTRDVELALRKRLALRLAESPAAPRELVFLLANDEIDVCYDILVRSPVLRDSDLIEIVHHRGLAHQMGIAIREDLAEEVSAVLVATGEENVIVALLNNETARISRDSMARIVGDSRHIIAFQGPLVQRADLPPELAHKMLMWVSVTLRNFIVRRFDIDPELLEDEIVEAAADVAAEDQARELSPAARLVEKLHAAGELTPAYAVKALGQGQVALFELAFAKLVSLEPRLARRIVFQRNSQGLAIACRAIGLDRAAFQALVRMLRKARAKDADPAPETMASLLEFYDGVSQEAANLTVAKWQRESKGDAPDARAVA